jgi:hypothetical protein
VHLRTLCCGYSLNWRPELEDIPSVLVFSKLYFLINILQCFYKETLQSARFVQMNDMTSGGLDIEMVRREILLGGRGRRACSEQSPGPSQHLWGHGGRRSPWCKKRTSAPQMGTQTFSTTIRTALILRSRRSWPVAPQPRR